MSQHNEKIFKIIFNKKERKEEKCELYVLFITKTQEFV